MSATVFAVLFGTSVALNDWLWFRSEHYREQASLSPEQRAQEWTPIEWPYGSYSSAIEGLLFQQEEERKRREKEQRQGFVTIANDDWKVNT